MKKSLNFFILFLSFVVSSNAADPKPLKVVALDCHGVLFKSLPWHVHNEALNFALRHYELLPYAVFSIPRFVYKCVTGMNLRIDTILEEFPKLQDYKEDIYSFIQLKGLIPEMVPLIKKLREQGIIVVLASNIHEDALAYNKKCMPEIFELFDILYTCAESNGNIKPEKSYFVHLHEFLCTKLNTHDLSILYVDDELLNATSAQAANPVFTGLFFSTPEKLQEYLYLSGYIF